MSITEIFHSMEYGTAPESAEKATQWLGENKNTFNHFINGQWQTPATKNYVDSNNPCNNTFIAKVADGNEQDVNEAVAAATEATKHWQGLSNHERSKYLYAIARQIQKHARLFSVLESLDNGKPIRESRDIDIPLVVRHFYYHAGCAQLRDSQLADYQPLGVIGQIIPWNFPLLMLAWKVAPALAMGNTVVLKPAEYTSATAVLFAQICQEVGLPKGVFNLVLGDAKAGSALVNHDDIAKIAFTGSTNVGKSIRKAIAGTGKKLSLELGGKSAFMVFDDADIDSAIEGIVDAIWFNQGQVCCAGSRLLVQENIALTFYQKLKARMQQLIVGDSMEKGIDMAAIVDQSQLKQITELVQLGIEEGATLYQPNTDLPECGLYFPPTLLTDVEPASTIAQQEIFGPVLAAMTFRTPLEAVQIANNSRYGLAASIWSENINLALDIAPQIKAGVIWINSTNLFDASAGFGGYRESGFGREGGIEGLYEYVQPKWQASLSSNFIQESKVNCSPNETQTINRTAKLYIGGKQVRPDSGYSIEVVNANGQVIGEVPDGSRKDIRNAVEACNKAASWSRTSGHQRAQILYFLAENLSARQQDFVGRIMLIEEKTEQAALEIFNIVISRIFHAAAMADKFEGQIHSPPQRAVTLAMKEAIGNLAIVAPHEAGFLGFISALLPALAMGNRVVIVPSQHSALLSTDFYQIIETSDIPAGVINIVTGDQNILADVLSKHYDVDCLWFWGDVDTCKHIESQAAENMKRTWLNYGKYYDWHCDTQACSTTFYQHATEIKNVWVPYGI